MRIISKFHDYYDGVQSLGQDKELVYVRKTESINKYFSFVHFPYSYRDSNKEYYQISPVSCFLIGFCGQYYRGYVFDIYKTKLDFTLLRYTTTIFYNKEELDEYKIDISNTFWHNGRINKATLFEINSPDKLYELFLKYKTPYFIIKQNYRSHEKDMKLVINPNLKTYQFYKIKDAYTAYQEIAMFLGGVLPRKENKMLKITNEEKIISKGFDKWSFRKRPKGEI